MAPRKDSTLFTGRSRSRAIDLSWQQFERLLVIEPTEKRTNAPSNIQALCRRCHMIVHKKKGIHD